MVDKEDNTNNHSYLAYGLERLLPLRQHCSAAREYIYQQYRQLGSVKIRVRPWDITLPLRVVFPWVCADH